MPPKTGKTLNLQWLQILRKWVIRSNLGQIMSKYMDKGGVDTTVIDSWQHKMGQMADFPALLAYSVFD